MHDVKNNSLSEVEGERFLLFCLG